MKLLESKLRIYDDWACIADSDALSNCLQFVEWGGQTDPDTFYTDDRIKGMYKDTIKAIVTHFNALTGLAFKDDPTILAWGKLVHGSAISS